MPTSLRRSDFLRLFTGGVLAAMALTPVAASAQEGMKLFKIITQKDEIVIGFSAADLAAMSGASDLDKIASKLRGAGQLEATQYVTRKAANGDLEQAPQKRVMILPADTLRIEPYSTPLKVLPPA
jgi:hypothetical protein